MSRYLSEDCEQCDEHIEPYGCSNHNCPIYQDIESYHADLEHDRRKDRRLEEEDR